MTDDEQNSDSWANQALNEKLRADDLASKLAAMTAVVRWRDAPWACSCDNCAACAENVESRAENVESRAALDAILALSTQHGRKGVRS